MLHILFGEITMDFWSVKLCYVNYHHILEGVGMLGGLGVRDVFYERTITSIIFWLCWDTQPFSISYGKMFAQYKNRICRSNARKINKT